MEKSNYTWVPFFRELSTKLLDYKNDRKALLELFYGLDEELVHAYREKGEKLTDINPFDIIGTMAVGGLERRTRFAKYYKNVFSLESEIPSDYDGIPSLNAQKVMFLYGSDKEKYTGLFWNLFGTVVNKGDISNLFNQVLKAKGVRKNLTMGLFWIDPESYLSLDSTNQQYLTNHYGFSKLPNLKKIDYKYYSDLLEKIRQKMNAGEIAEKIFLDFSYAAWESKSVKKAVPRPDLVRTWIYSPGEGASEWEKCLEDGEMTIGWSELGDYRQYGSKADMAKKMDRKGSNTNNSLGCWNFVHVLKEGDIVYAKKGTKIIVGRGVVTSGYIYDENRKRFTSIRKVEWTKIDDLDVGVRFASKTLTDITRKKLLVEKLNSQVSQNALAEPSVKQDNVDNTHHNYWWLCAKPSVWKASELEVGKEQYYTLYNERGNKRRIFQNFLDAKNGDPVICYEVTPILKITSLFEVSQESDGKTVYFRKKEQLSVPIPYSDFSDNPELSNMEFLKNLNGSFFKLSKEEYEILMDLIRDSNPNTVLNFKKYTKEDFLKDVFLEESDLNELKGLLLHKKNIILQGAPGVGKTYCAKRLAYEIMGEEDNSRICLVQFHQNYSYEDFVMGFRPLENKDGFKLKEGVFYNFCKKVIADPDKKKPYFFIIDEINRGNLSKIFGELLMLIENDYRGKEHKLRLAYREEDFYVPENLYIIGMMNTADRSLAMIDYALRRRFGFYDMKPAFNSKGFKKMQKSYKNTHFDNLVSAIIELNKEIKKDDSLGEGFEIGHSYLCFEDKDMNNLESLLKQVIHYEIMPLLKEYWFDNKDNIEKAQKEFNKVFND